MAERADRTTPIEGVMVMSGTAKFALVMCLAMLVVTGCDRDSATRSIETMSAGNAVRHHDPGKVARGQRVYQEHCAVCHGDKGQGAFTWRQRDADGFYPPPPLNGSGHAWHHSTAALREVIKNGGPAGRGKMPAWSDKLSDEDIDAVIEWFQSQWPDQVYGEWYAMEQRSFGR